MALTITHTFVSSKSDGSDDTVVRPSNWNDTHTVGGSLGSDQLSGNYDWIGYTTFAATGSGAVFGIQVNAYADTGETSEAIAISTGGGLTSGSVLDNFYGLYVNNPNSPVDATLQNIYGVYILNQNDSIHTGNAYNLYSVGANSANVFEGSVGIGTPPSFALHVVGDISRLNSKVWLGDDPVCDNAKVTVYQTTMNGDTNSSMFDIVAANNNSMTDMTAVVINTQARGDISDSMIGLFVKNSNFGGTIGNSIGIKIDTPDSGESHAGVQTGLLINNQDNGSGSTFYNLYSSGFTSINVFEGFVGIGTTAANFPLVVSHSTGIQSGYGLINAAILCAGTESGLALQNTSADGHQYTFLSTGTGSNLPTGMFVIGDGTAVQPRFVIDLNGQVGVGTTTPEAQFHSLVHTQNAVGILGEGYANTSNGTGIGVKGIASVGASNTVSFLHSLVAGSPELDDGSVVAEAVGLFVEDVTIGQHNYAIKTGLGTVLLGGWLNPGTSVQFEPSALPRPQASDFNITVFGPGGSTTYTYVVTRTDGIRETIASDPIVATDAPSTLDGDNYVGVNFPNDGISYKLYRTGGGPVGYLTTQTNGAYIDNNLFTPSGSSAPGPLPFNYDASSGLLIGSTAPFRALYTTSMGGLILGANGSYETDLRLSTLTNSWADSTLGVSLLQIANTLNNNLAMTGGSVNNFSQFDRLTIHSHKTIFTDATLQSTPDSDAIITIFTPDSDSVQRDLTRWLAPNQSVMARITSSGAMWASKFKSSINTVVSGPSPVFDLSLGDIQLFTTNGDATMTFTNIDAGQTFTLVVIVDTNGPRSWTWDNRVLGGMDLSSSAASTINVQQFTCPNGSIVVATSAGVSIPVSL